MATRHIPIVLGDCFLSLIQKLFYSSAETFRCYSRILLRRRQLDHWRRGILAIETDLL